jgi:hypothetical protein
MPKLLTYEHKLAHNFCSNIVKKGEAFLQWIFTGNETRVHHYEPASKLQSMEWKYYIAQDQEIRKMCLLQVK